MTACPNWSFFWKKKTSLITLQANVYYDIYITADLPTIYFPVLAFMLHVRYLNVV